MALNADVLGMAIAATLLKITTGVSQKQDLSMLRKKSGIQYLSS